MSLIGGSAHRYDVFPLAGVHKPLFQRVVTLLAMAEALLVTAERLLASARRLLGIAGRLLESR
jgi:hypothetical protein